MPLQLHRLTTVCCDVFIAGQHGRGVVGDRGWMDHAQERARSAAAKYAFPFPGPWVTWTCISNLAGASLCCPIVAADLYP